MNQEKIGKFIAKCRKDKNMTQQDLADKLNLTKNAISKWERGISLMDISLLKPVSEILGVSVSELLNGEKIKNMDVNIIDNTITQSANIYIKKEKKKFLKNCFLYIIIGIFAIFFILTIISEINYGRIPIGNKAYIDFQNISSRLARKNANKYMQLLLNKNIDELDSLVVSNNEYLVEEGSIETDFKKLLEDSHSKSYRENLSEFYNKVQIIDYDYKYFYYNGTNYTFSYDLYFNYNNQKYTVGVQLNGHKNYVQLRTFIVDEKEIELYDDLYNILFKVFYW